MDERLCTSKTNGITVQEPEGLARRAKFNVAVAGERPIRICGSAGWWRA